MKKRKFFSAVAVMTMVSMIATPSMVAVSETRGEVKLGNTAVSEREFGELDDKLTVSGENTVKVTGNINGGLKIGDKTKINPDTGKEEKDIKADANVSVAGNINKDSSTSKSNSGQAIDIDTSGGKVKLNVKGGATAESDTTYAGSAVGIKTAGQDKAKIDVEVDGDVKAAGYIENEDGKNDVRGVYSDNEDADTTINVNGNVSSEGLKSSGIYTTNTDDGKITITVNGDVSSKAVNGRDLKKRADGILTAGEADKKESKKNSITEININGNISAVSTNPKENEEKLFNGINSEYNDGKTTIKVDGDVSGDSYGINVVGNNGELYIVSTGVISGGDSAVKLKTKHNMLLEEKDEAGNDVVKDLSEIPDITVWKLASDSGDLVKAEKTTYTYEKDEEGNLNETAAKVEEDKAMADKVLSSINYIIKASAMEDGKETSNGKIVLKGALGSVSVNGKTYDTAHQDETLTINVTTVSGYKYSLRNGEALLTANADGSYTLKVPAGGGIDLQAVIEKIQTNNNTNTSTNNNTTTKISSGSSSRNRSSRSSSGGGSGSYVQVGASGIPDTMIGKNTSSTPGSWSKDINGNWIYNNTTGNAYKSTWITTKNQWYFLNSNGNPLTGWQYINGAWYYLSTVDTAEHPYGSMYVSGKTPDGYTIGADGKIKR